MAAPSVTFTAATAWHARELAPTMRAADAAEVRASGGYSPLEALEASLMHSAHAWACLFDGQVAALFGLVPLRRPGALTGPACAAAWLLTGELVQRHPRAFLRACEAVVPALLQKYPVLTNHVDARYTAALRWARWLGFEVGGPVPFGEAGLPFHPITLKAPHV